MAGVFLATRLIMEVDKAGSGRGLFPVPHNLGVGSRRAVHSSDSGQQNNIPRKLPFISSKEEISVNYIWALSKL